MLPTVVPYPEPGARAVWWSRYPEHLHVLFAAERRAPGGDSRLVVVQFDEPAFVVGDPRPFRYRIIAPDGRFGDWITLVGWVDATFAPPADARTRLFAGRPDLADPSRFTLPYDAGGVPGTIDGWLRNDDTVHLAVRDGPVKAP